MHSLTVLLASPMSRGVGYDEFDGPAACCFSDTFLKSGSDGSIVDISIGYFRIFISVFDHRRMSVKSMRRLYVEIKLMCSKLSG